MTRVPLLSFACAAAFLLPAAQGRSAPPAVPARLAYQGSLFDGSGAPRTGPIDLVVRVYDAASGGTLLYTQAFPATPLADGVFSLELGPTGAATDSPTDPLTTSLAAVFEGDLAATGPDRFLELTVGSEGPLGRSQILSAPFAVRAVSADLADAAQSAETADTATQVVNLGAFPVEAFTEFFEHTNLDDSGPGNADPSEGVADVDGDGLANFLDPDNDDDGLDDSTEVGLGTDLNLVTPTLTGFSPPEGAEGLTSQVTALGTNFLPGLTVVFGSETPAPANLTPTSFDVDVAPTPVGIRPVQVTLPNGETAGSSFEFRPFRPQFAVTTNAQTQFGLSVKDPLRAVVTGQVAYALDRSGNQDLEGVSLPGVGQVAVTWGPGGVLYGLRCRFLSLGQCGVELLRDDDGDGLLEDAEVVASVETLSDAQLLAPDLAFDSAGRAVAAYHSGKVLGGDPATPRLVRDLDGDGDFDGPGEFQTFSATQAAPNGLALALDAADRAAFAYYRFSSLVRVFHDRNGDGDFDDTLGGNPETFDLATGVVACVGLAFDPSGRLALVTGFDGQPTTLRRDLDLDGDFGDVGESLALASPGGQDCDAAGGPGAPLAVVYHAGSTVLLAVDLDDDGTFTGFGEVAPLGAYASDAHLAVTHDGEGDVWVAVKPAGTGEVLPDL